MIIPPSSPEPPYGCAIALRGCDPATHHLLRKLTARHTSVHARLRMIIPPSMPEPPYGCAIALRGCDPATHHLLRKLTARHTSVTHAWLCQEPCPDPAITASITCTRCAIQAGRLSTTHTFLPHNKPSKGYPLQPRACHPNPSTQPRAIAAPEITRRQPPCRPPSCARPAGLRAVGCSCRAAGRASAALAPGGRLWCLCVLP
jgi:hypothetical protein